MVSILEMAAEEAGKPHTSLTRHRPKTSSPVAPEPAQAPPPGMAQTMMLPPISPPHRNFHGGSGISGAATARFAYEGSPPPARASQSPTGSAGVSLAQRHRMAKELGWHVGDATVMSLLEDEHYGVSPEYRKAMRHS